MDTTEAGGAAATHLLVHERYGDDRRPVWRLYPRDAWDPARFSTEGPGLPLLSAGGGDLAGWARLRLPADRAFTGLRAAENGPLGQEVFEVLTRAPQPFTAPGADGGAR